MATSIQHLDGIPWYEAPAPPERHTHWPQTWGWIDFTYVERCPCGAMRNRFPDPWVLLDAPRVAEKTISRPEPVAQPDPNVTVGIDRDIQLSILQVALVFAAIVVGAVLVFVGVSNVIAYGIGAALFAGAIVIEVRRVKSSASE